MFRYCHRYAVWRIQAVCHGTSFVTARHSSPSLDRSGQGRELGPDAVRAWQEVRSILPCHKTFALQLMTVVQCPSRRRVFSSSCKNLGSCCNCIYRWGLVVFMLIRRCAMYLFGNSLGLGQSVPLPQMQIRPALGENGFDVK